MPDIVLKWTPIQADAVADGLETSVLIVQHFRDLPSEKVWNARAQIGQLYKHGVGKWLETLGHTDGIVDIFSPRGRDDGSALACDVRCT